MRIRKAKKIFGSFLVTGFTWGFASPPIIEAQENSSILINANIASEYVVTSMPMTKPGCPLLGYLRFFPGGSLQGIFVTDMARSKSIPFNGTYVLTDGKKITFTSEDPTVPIKNINGSIARSVTLPAIQSYRINNQARKLTTGIPIEYLILTTATTECANEQYKLTLTMDDE
jgi:hypothetical protein